jgi:hypothetical protein
MPDDMDAVHREKADRFLHNKLNFSDEQMQTFKNLQQEHFTMMRQTRESIENLKHQLYDTELSEKDGNIKVDSLVSQLGIFYSQQERETYEHINKIKAICSPEQMKDMEGMMKRLIFNQHQHYMQRNRSKNSQNKSN